jgi:hypothetical protein
MLIITHDIKMYYKYQPHNVMENNNHKRYWNKAAFIEPDYNYMFILWRVTPL